MNLKNTIALLVLAALLSGCASGVKLDEVPVEDRAGSATPASTSSAQSSGVREAATGGGAPDNTRDPANHRKSPPRTTPQKHFY